MLVRFLAVQVIGDGVRDVVWSLCPRRRYHFANCEEGGGLQVGNEPVAGLDFPKLFPVLPNGRLLVALIIITPGRRRTGTASSRASSGFHV